MINKERHLRYDNKGSGFPYREYDIRQAHSRTMKLVEIYLEKTGKEYKDIAERFSIPKQTMSNYVNRPSLVGIMLLSTELGIDLNYLFFGENPKFPKQFRKNVLEAQRKSLEEQLREIEREQKK